MFKQTFAHLTKYWILFRSQFCFQALALLSHPFICQKHPNMESQIKKHFLFSVELLARLVSGQTTLNYRFLRYITVRKNEKATMSQDELDNED